MQKRMDKGLIRNIKKRGITVDGPGESAGQYYSLEKIQANKYSESLDRNINWKKIDEVNEKKKDNKEFLEKVLKNSQDRKANKIQYIKQINNFPIQKVSNFLQPQQLFHHGENTLKLQNGERFNNMNEQKIQKNNENTNERNIINEINIIPSDKFKNLERNKNIIQSELGAHNIKSVSSDTTTVLNIHAHSIMHQNKRQSDKLLNQASYTHILKDSQKNEACKSLDIFFNESNEAPNYLALHEYSKNKDKNLQGKIQILSPIFTNNDQSNQNNFKVQNEKINLQNQIRENQLNTKPISDYNQINQNNNIYSQNKNHQTQNIETHTHINHANVQKRKSQRYEESKHEYNSLSMSSNHNNEDKNKNSMKASLQNDYYQEGIQDQNMIQPRSMISKTPNYNKRKQQSQNMHMNEQIIEENQGNLIFDNSDQISPDDTNNVPQSIPNTANNRIQLTNLNNINFQNQNINLKHAEKSNIKKGSQNMISGVETRVDSKNPASNFQQQFMQIKQKRNVKISETQKTDQLYFFNDVQKKKQNLQKKEKKSGSNEKKEKTTSIRVQELSQGDIYQPQMQMFQDLALSNNSQMSAVQNEINRQDIRSMNSDLQNIQKTSRVLLQPIHELVNDQNKIRKSSLMQSKPKKENLKKDSKSKNVKKLPPLSPPQIIKSNAVKTIRGNKPNLIQKDNNKKSIDIKKKISKSPEEVSDGGSTPKQLNIKIENASFKKPKKEVQLDKVKNQKAEKTIKISPSSNKKPNEKKQEKSIQGKQLNSIKQKDNKNQKQSTSQQSQPSEKKKKISLKKEIKEENISQTQAKNQTVKFEKPKESIKQKSVKQESTKPEKKKDSISKKQPSKTKSQKKSPSKDDLKNQKSQSKDPNAEDKLPATKKVKKSLNSKKSKSKLSKSKKSSKSKSIKKQKSIASESSQLKSLMSSPKSAKSVKSVKLLSQNSSQELLIFVDPDAIKSLNKVKSQKKWDTACDPIDFFSTRVLFDKEKEKEIEKEVNKVQNEDLKQLNVNSKDWANSRLLQFVIEQKSIGAINRNLKIKQLEQHYMNPREIDIFSEEEATYNCIILKERVESCILNEEPISFTDDFYLKLMSQKARRTVHVLSNFLLLNKSTQKDIIDLLREDDLLISQIESNNQNLVQTKQEDYQVLLSPMGLKKDIIGQIKQYTFQSEGTSAQTGNQQFNQKQQNIRKSFELDPNNLIKHLLRCKMLYQAYSEIKNILQLILKQLDIFTRPNSSISLCLKFFMENKFGNENSLIKKSSQLFLDQNQLDVIEKAMNTLQKLSRRISHFLNDHKVFKTIIFRNQNYQKTILQFARTLSMILKEYLINQQKDLNEYQIQKIQLFENPIIGKAGHLIFVEREIEINLSKQEILDLFQYNSAFQIEEKKSVQIRRANYLPLLNPKYGEGKYDGRLEKEFIKKDQEAILINNLEQLKLEQQQKGDKQQKQTEQQITEELYMKQILIKQTLKENQQILQSSKMFEMSQLESYRSLIKKQSMNLELQKDEIHKGNFYEASMLELTSFKDSQMGIQTEQAELQSLKFAELLLSVDENEASKLVENKLCTIDTNKDNNNQNQQNNIIKQIYDDFDECQTENFYDKRQNQKQFSLDLL